MILSATERSYLYELLQQTPPIRPDGRSNKQFRPIQSHIGFLDNSNGSAKITLSDGSECIVSIKAEVVEKSTTNELVSVDVDVSGHRDDTSFILNLQSSLKTLYLKHISSESLNLTTKFAYKLFIDVLVISNYSYPLTLMTFTSYLALNNTYLPKITSSVDDKEIEEQPTFHDYEFNKLIGQFPIVFTVAIIGKNYIIDPNIEEMEVSDNGLIISWFNGKPISPIQNVKLNDGNLKSVKPQLILQSIDLVKEVANDVINSLNSAE
ncbi:hypothetical protein BN7_831 [Wickerhamomyces ciferrii]|uniref:Ribosomal RNA-processing protein 42 n=1 Tax=Wickerhamomyces ciferrii (strain ATCC 14091 / BCRC 22168 / CBS 111 / JCM 3599 / NBRC 0793 / NRRL Y-1031 F-60-10) TaxID=1206466 RepID=K0KIS2_WICCF|nr:uncharacterized protein BN7_831 [Wickerhamomyces ciferrii]CCH41294.1 hypothetical protein BN7_831 [Wickerhamomyces ciferrii]